MFMDLSKKDLKEIIKEELGVYRNPMLQFFHMLKMFLCGNEMLPAQEVLYSLRFYEYYFNKKNPNIFEKALKFFWHFTFRNRQLKHSIFIEPNSVQKGLKLTHPGFRKIPEFVHIGKNSTILPMVLIGKKKPGIEGKAIIGDNCYISTGVTILAPVNIGDNVTIGAGAVVTKDIPSNTTVAGVPARKIKKVPIE